MKFMRRKKRLLYIILGLGSTLTVAIVTPLVLQNSNNNTKEIKSNPNKDILDIKKTLEKIQNKEIKIDITSGNINQNKKLLLEKLEKLNGYPKNLKGVKVGIKSSSNEISTKAKPFDILLEKNHIFGKVSGFTIKRTINNIENSQSFIKTIKDKITNTNLTIDKDVDTSTDSAILAAIKTQLKKDNKSLTNDDLAKITDNISSLTPGNPTSTILTITVGSGEELATDTIKIILTRPKNEKENNEEIKENNKQIINKIKNKITIRDLTISKNINTSTEAQILRAIRSTLLKENTSLKKSELLKITTNIVQLTPGVRTKVELKIEEGVAPNVVSSKIIITIIRHKSDAEINFDKINQIYNAIKERNINIAKTTTTSTPREISIAIKERLRHKYALKNDDLAKITIDIDKLIAGRVTPTRLTIKIGQQNRIVGINVLKSITSIKVNLDNVEKIYNKIKDVSITIPKNTDTSDDAKILAAIKTQLKLENTSLLNSDLTKINDNIDSLTPGKFTKILLKITIGTQSKKIQVNVIRPKTNVELIKTIKDKITNTNLTIDKDVDTSTDSAILAAIKTQLQIENPTLTLNDLAKIIDNISSLTPGTRTFVTLTIQIGNDSETINIYATRNMTIDEEIQSIKEKLEKIQTKEILIDATPNSTIKENKNLIIQAIQNLSGYPGDLKNTTVWLKANQDSKITIEGTQIIIIVTKLGGTTQEITTFKIKRQPTPTEQANIDVQLLKKAINDIQNKEIPAYADSGTIEEMKSQILNNLKKLISINLNGVEIKVKENQNDAILKEGTPITFVISKKLANDVEISNFKVKLSEKLVFMNLDIDIKKISERAMIARKENIKLGAIKEEKGYQQIPELQANKNIIAIKINLKGEFGGFVQYGTLAQYESDKKTYLELLENKKETPIMVAVRESYFKWNDSKNDQILKDSIDTLRLADAWNTRDILDNIWNDILNHLNDSKISDVLNKIKNNKRFNYTIRESSYSEMPNYKSLSGRQEKELKDIIPFINSFIDLSSDKNETAVKDLISKLGTIPTYLKNKYNATVAKLSSLFLNSRVKKFKVQNLQLYTHEWSEVEWTGLFNTSLVLPKQFENKKVRYSSYLVDVVDNVPKIFDTANANYKNPLAVAIGKTFKDLINNSLQNMPKTKELLNSTESLYSFESFANEMFNNLKKIKLEKLKSLKSDYSSPELFNNTLLSYIKSLLGNGFIFNEKVIKTFNVFSNNDLTKKEWYNIELKDLINSSLPKAFTWLKLWETNTKRTFVELLNAIKIDLKNAKNNNIFQVIKLNVVNGDEKLEEKTIDLEPFFSTTSGISFDDLSKFIDTFDKTDKFTTIKSTFLSKLEGWLAKEADLTTTFKEYWDKEIKPEMDKIKNKIPSITYSFIVGIKDFDDLISIKLKEISQDLIPLLQNAMKTFDKVMNGEGGIHLGIKIDMISSTIFKFENIYNDIRGITVAGYSAKDYMPDLTVKFKEINEKIMVYSKWINPFNDAFASIR